MKDSMNCHLVSHRFEIIGVILIAIATALTIATGSSLGIVMLFLVGLALCCPRHFRGFLCHCRSTDDVNCCRPEINNEEILTEQPPLVPSVPPLIKTPKTTRTTKKDIIG